MHVIIGFIIRRIYPSAISLLRAGGKTIILIAHRLSTVVSADKIAVLKAGKLIEEGTHNELLEKDGLYTSMWHKQFPTLRATVKKRKSTPSSLKPQT